MSLNRSSNKGIFYLKVLFEYRLEFLDCHFKRFLYKIYLCQSSRSLVTINNKSQVPLVPTKETPYISTEPHPNYTLELIRGKRSTNPHHLYPRHTSPTRVPRPRRDVSGDSSPASPVLPQGKLTPRGLVWVNPLSVPKPDPTPTPLMIGLFHKFLLIRGG